MDIVPTCLELAGATYPDTLDGHALLPLEGQSFASLLKGESWTGHDMLFWEHRGNRAARKGPWKIVSSYPEDQWRLYHIPSDRVEEKDLSERHPETKTDLIQAYDQWANEVGVVHRKELKKMGF